MDRLMLTPAENELITRVGPDADGDTAAPLWHPIFQARPAGRGNPGASGCSPRTTSSSCSGRAIGSVAEACPHRGASLVLARTEDCALRCLFHGWKIDVSGEVVDVPSEPSERERFGRKVKVRHFPTREAGGVVWAYVGAGEPSPFPDFPFTHLPADRIKIVPVPINSNWLQGIEGQIDSSHVSILHSSTVTTVSTRVSPQAALTQQYFLADRAPTFEVETTGYGLRAAAIRNIGDGLRFARVTEFCMPYWSCIPGPFDQDNGMIGQLPVDDTHTIQWYIFHNFEQPIDAYGQAQGFQSMLEEIGESSRRLAGPENEWSQDRNVMDGGHWSGFASALWEDIAITESQGGIADRSHEYLGRSDAAIARLRRILIDAARDNEHGRPVRGIDGEVNFREIFGRQATYPAGGAWSDAVSAVGLPAVLQH